MLSHSSMLFTCLQRYLIFFRLFARRFYGALAAGKPLMNTTPNFFCFFSLETQHMLLEYFSPLSCQGS
jgi:hypothetical protein